jgi:hypothetical protein
LLWDLKNLPLLQLLLLHLILLLLLLLLSQVCSSKLWAGTARQFDHPR